MMARLHLDQDLFSPIRFDASFADSSNNSEGSSSNIELISSFMNTPKAEHNLLGLKLNERRNDSVSDFDNFVQDLKLKESKTSNCDSKALSRNSSADSFNSTISLDSKLQNLHKQSSKHKRISKENSKTFKDKNVASQLKENVEDPAKVLESCEQNDLKIRKLPRPTSLSLSKDKQTESTTVKESKKKDNKIFRKSASSKNICKKGANKESSVNTSEKNCQIGKTCVKSEKNLRTIKSEENLSAEKANRKHKVPGNDSESIKPEIVTQELSHSRSTSNLPPHSQYEVSIEKMVRDHISFECDKIRQNMYTQQMYFYRQLNKIKDEMEQQHAASTEHMCKVIEKLMQVGVSVENLPTS